MKTYNLLFVIMIISLIIINGCDGKPTAPKPDPEPATVTSVTVSPQTVVVLPGQQRQFSAVVSGTNNPQQTVSWAVVALSGSIRPGTSITQSGLLTVASGETVSFLSVTATSVFDPSMSGGAGVSTTGTLPSVTRVEINPNESDVWTGGSCQFSATVIGYNNPPQNVNWVVLGGGLGTSINQNGLLIVASNESHQNVLTVKASSTFDPSKYETVPVLVIDNSYSIDENWVSIYNEIDISPRARVELLRASPFDPHVSVRVNGTNCQYLQSYNLPENGHYRYTGYFSYTTPFTMGNTYAIILTIDGVDSSGNLKIAHPPSVTHPATFNHTLNTTFNWTVTESAHFQALFISYYSGGQSVYVVDDVLHSSVRNFVLPANTVPPNYYTLSFDLEEVNTSVSGSTIFMSQAGYRKIFDRPYGVESLIWLDSEKWYHIQSIIRDYLKQ